MQVYQYERQIQDIDMQVKSRYEKREKIIREEFEREVDGLKLQNSELNQTIRTLRDIKISSLNKQIQKYKQEGYEKDAYIRQLTIQKSAMEKNSKEIEKDLKTVKMQYKMSICNNETLVKGLK